MTRNLPGHFSRQPAASSISSVDFGRSPVSLSSGTDDSTWRRPHPSRVECHPSAISPAVEPLSGAEQVTVNPQPYFVPPTASASDILANVAIQDLIAQESDAEFHDLPYYHTSIPSLASASDSYDRFDFETPVTRGDYSDSDWEHMEEWTLDNALQSPPKPSTSSNQSPGLGVAPLPSLLHINKEIRVISSSMLEDTFRRTTRPNSLPCEDDGGVVIVSPDPSFPHPHLLSTIIEEDGDEEPSSPERDSEDEDEDETSDTETIRPSRSYLVADCQWTQESMSRPEC